MKDIGIITTVTPYEIEFFGDDDMQYRIDNSAFFKFEEAVLEEIRDIVGYSEYTRLTEMLDNEDLKEFFEADYTLVRTAVRNVWSSTPSPSLNFDIISYEE